MLSDKHYKDEFIDNGNGVLCQVIDIAKVAEVFETDEIKWGKKTKPILIRTAKAGEVIETVVSAKESHYVCTGGEAIFINELEGGKLDIFVPRTPENVPSGWDILSKRYEVIGPNDEKGGTYYRPIFAPCKLLHETIGSNSCVMNCWGEGNHAFLYEGATLKQEADGRITGIDKLAFDQTWSITNKLGKIQTQQEQGEAKGR